MVYDGLARPTGIDWGNAGKTFGQVKFGDDSNQVVLFYTRSVFNAYKSKAMGSRQYENQIWVKMHPAGEKLNIIDRPIEDRDKLRFPQQWNLFLQNKTQIPEGTPIDLLFPNDPAKADNLKAFGIYTIQQCANLSDTAIQTIGMGATDWKNLSVKYLQSASDGTAFLKLQSELEEERRKTKILSRQFDQLKHQYGVIMQKLEGPNSPILPGDIDAGEEVINAMHPSQEARPTPKKKKNSGPSKDAIDQANLLKQVTEEDFPTVDVTKE